MTNYCIRVELLGIVKRWLLERFARVKWNVSWSNVFQVCSAVIQGLVLSPYLFAIYIDDRGNLFSVLSKVDNFATFKKVEVHAKNSTF